MIDCLDEHDPTRELHSGNMKEFCLALEGVSHFLYVAWNAGYDRCVTLLELELQAEVDKYVTLVDVLKQRCDHHIPPRLRDWLFEQVTFDPNLSDEALGRYRDANYFAGKYCMNLESRYVNDRRDGELSRELRKFYRLPQGEKIRLIESSV